MSNESTAYDRAVVPFHRASAVAIIMLPIGEIMVSAATWSVAHHQWRFG